MKSIPSFFNYKEENTDNGYEMIQDFFLSWTLRCAVENIESSEFPNLNEYSKKVLLNLIYDDNPPENLVVKSVITKRQWSLIDLLAEVTIEVDGVTKEYVLNIENKWYSSIRNGQLEKSKEATIVKYSDKKYSIINLIVLPDFVRLDNNLKNIAANLNYKIKVIEEIKEETDMINKTGNYLFDEYWFKFYN